MDDEERTPVDEIIIEDLTPIIPPRIFVADALRHLADSFEGAIRRCREYAGVVSDPVRGRLALEELADFMREHATTAIGVARALRRVVEHDEKQNGERK